jgi:hypothetical protein
MGGERIGGSLTAAQREDIVAGHEPITGLLQSVADARKELSPCIPFLRLQDHGGQLNWTCPLDNASAVPDQVTLSHLPVERKVRSYILGFIQEQRDGLFQPYFESLLNSCATQYLCHEFDSATQI